MVSVYRNLPRNLSSIFILVIIVWIMLEIGKFVLLDFSSKKYDFLMEWLFRMEVVKQDNAIMI